MIYESLDKRIAEAMIEEKNESFKLKTNFWKSVKTEMVNATHKGMVLPNEDEELKILRSMLKRSNNAAEEFSKSNSEIAKENFRVCQFESSELQKLLPKEPSEEEVNNETLSVIELFVTEQLNDDPNWDIKTLQRNTKNIINIVKAKYPTANNGIIANAIKKFINAN